MRDGQIYFVHNRVESIFKRADEIRALVPKLTIDVAHGQMDGDTLEKKMLEFYKGDAQMLLSTTIIESGLDIPRANTIIIDDAQNFGLAQLYQLRGRVEAVAIANPEDAAHGGEAEGHHRGGRSLEQVSAQPA